ncbi:SDR family oxidoreductase [Streptomyces sp. NPDC000878]
MGGAEGAFVVVSGRDERRGAEVVARIEEDGGAAAFVKAEVAAAVVFLASDEASQVHGVTLTVDGGFTAVQWRGGAPDRSASVAAGAWLERAPSGRRLTPGPRASHTSGRRGQY